MPKRAAIDTDYLSHLTAIRDYNDVFELIVRFFTALDVEVLMHPLVGEFEKSPTPNPVLDKLFSEGIITLPAMTDILCAKPGGKLLYEGMVSQIYGDFTGIRYPLGNMYSNWPKRQSFGEVHTATMCVLLDCKYLFSDDTGAVRHLSRIIKSQTQATVEILNRKMSVERLVDSALISRKERRLISYERP